MMFFTYYRLHYFQCLGIQQRWNTSLLLSAAMYTDSEGDDEDGVVMNLDWKLAANGGYLLRGKINDVGGIYSKLGR